MTVVNGEVIHRRVFDYNDVVVLVMNSVRAWPFTLWVERKENVVMVILDNDEAFDIKIEPASWED